MQNARAVGTRAPIYLDLFEDGLYAQAAGIGDSTRYERLLNDLRFHAALAILFDRPLAVPEPWYTSSPAFLRVAKEILAAYRPHAMTGPVTGRARVVSFPFCFQHFGGTEAQGVRLYLSALHQRLMDGRQVLLTPAFGEIGQTPNDAEWMRRTAVAEVLAMALADPGFGSQVAHITELTRQISEAAASAEHEDAALNLGEDLNVFLSALATEPPRRHHFAPINVPRMTASFRNFEREIHRVVHRGGIEEFVDENLLADYRHMFVRLQGQDQGTLVNRYLRYLKQADIPEASKEFIWSTGRFAIHNAYADSIGPQSLTISSNHYCSTHTPKSVHTAFHNLIGFVAPLNNPAVQRNEDGAAEIPLTSYDMAASIPWHSVWMEIYDIAASPQWVRFRKDISEAIRQERRTQGDERYWREIFDQVNDKLQTLHFKSSGGYRLAVVRNLVKTHADDITRAAKGMETPLGDGVESRFSLGLTGVKVLLGLMNNCISGPRYFNAIRLGSSARTQFNRIITRR